MKNICTLLLTCLVVLSCGTVAHERSANYARAPRFKALLYYSEGGEDAHVDFAKQGIRFFQKLTVGDGLRMDVATDLTAYSYEELRGYSCIIMLSNAPHSQAERALFEKYMTHGGGWMGFHVAGGVDQQKLPDDLPEHGPRGRMLLGSHREPALCERPPLDHQPRPFRQSL